MKVNELPQEVREAILAHAREDMPREACGVVLVEKGRVRYARCRNTAEGKGQFVMHAGDLADAEDRGDLVAIVHSHCYAQPTPSQADLVACEETGLPWIIVSVPNETWAELAPSGYRAPLKGRKWTHGVLDCYSLIRDWFHQERGVVLPDFERDEYWYKKGLDLYAENFEPAGFRKIDVPMSELQVGDCYLMQIKSPVINHAAINVGGGKILHHLRDRVSGEEVYGGWYRKITRAVVRYYGPPDGAPLR
jgi:proteasome lid subunit RPN8/RPN11